MANTTNFGWETPDDTDLVKDGAAAMRTLGNSIDASFVDLKGGTTGQILSKASNTDLDYTWINNDQGDITEVVAGTGISGGGVSGSVTITNTMATAIDAKGDLVAGTGADAFSRLAVGANDTVLTADSSTATGLKWAAVASGGLTLLSTTTITTTTTTLSSISQSYTHLLLELDSFASDSNFFPTFRYGNSVVHTADYFQGGFRTPKGGTFGTASNTNDTSIDLACGTSCLANRGANSWWIFIPWYTDTTNYKTVQINGTFTGPSDVIQNVFASASNTNNGVINIIRVIASAGTPSGTIRLYGVK